MSQKLLLLGVAIGLLASVASAQDKSRKVKVFILAGQSNMQGKGSADHLKELVKSEPDKYGWLMKDGQWTERDDVCVFFNGRAGKLQVGSFTHPVGQVGPEVGFGRVLGDAIAEPVILLKACWGGQSLAIDFRPPSAGKWDKPFNPDDGMTWKPGTIGWAYKEIFNHKHKALDDFAKMFPDLTGREYEIGGVLWFQGWNDLIHADRAKEYKTNLTCFKRDLRKDLQLPKLPFVIAVERVGGKESSGGQLAVREAQMTIAEEPEFKGTVTSVQTWPFWDETKRGEGGYHYNGSASFFIQAGEAFGQAMLGLLKRPENK